MSDPVTRLRRWLEAATRIGVPLPEAAALATATRGGRPSVRFVLVKQIDHHGLVFFTDRRSRKGRELARNPRAALVLNWTATGRQVRVEGRVEPVSAAEANTYWETRPRASRLAARASCQSAPLRSRAGLVARWEGLRRRHRGRAIPRPAHWTGFRLVPEVVEFWTHRAHRLHDRELFRRRRRGWKRRRLQP